MIYVDDIEATVVEEWSARWPFKTHCHLAADTLDELHEFAARLGLKRSWFQEHPALDHYDLTQNKRRLAVRLGAREVSALWLLKRLGKRRRAE